MPGTPVSIFISYSRRNSSFVDKLEADLQMRTFSTWVDREKSEGTQEWKRVLQIAIDQCDIILIVLSPTSMLSRYVQMEYNYALHKGKAVICLEYQECRELPIELQGARRISFTARYQRGLRDLLVALGYEESDTGPLLKVMQGSYVEQVRQAQEAHEWRKVAGFWQVLLDLEPKNREVLLHLEQCWREQGKDARANGDWEQAISAWEALLKLKPGDDQGLKQLALAQHNRAYEQYYRDARQFIEENERSLAQTQLQWLWKYAPDYGDPGELAQIAGITRPPRSPATRDEEGKSVKTPATMEVGEQVTVKRPGTAIKPGRKPREPGSLETLPAGPPAKPTQDYAPSPTKPSQQWFLPPTESQQAWLPPVTVPPLSSAAQVQEEGENAEGRSPGWFIKYKLGTTRGAVWFSIFLLLSGTGAALGIMTQSVSWALVGVAITTLLAYMLGSHRTIHRLPERLQRRTMQNTWEDSSVSPATDKDSDSTAAYVIVPLAIIVLCGFITFFFAKYVSHFRYDEEQISHFLGFTRSWWAGRQIKAGLATGAMLAFIIIMGYKPWNGFTTALRSVLLRDVFLELFCWLICGLFAFLINWGWGVGGGWDINLLGFVIGIVGGAGLGSSLVIWAKGKPIF